MNWIFRPSNRLKIKTLGRYYVGRDEILLHAAFQILTDFYEKEDLDQIKDDTRFEELKNLYLWWKRDRPNRFKVFTPDLRAETIRLFRTAHEEMDQKQLYKLIDLRDLLWI